MKRTSELENYTINNIKPIGNRVKDVPYTAIITFENLKWVGTSNQGSFKLVASTALNLWSGETNKYNNLINVVKQMSIKDLYNLITKEVVLPLSKGSEIAKEVVNSLKNKSINIENAYKQMSNNSITPNEKNNVIEQTMSLFATAQGTYEVIKNLFKSTAKSIETNKIFVSSNVKKIEVCYIIWFVNYFFFRFLMICLKKSWLVKVSK